MIAMPRPRATSRLAPLAPVGAVVAAAAGAVALGPPTPDHRGAALFAAAVCLAGSIAAWTSGLVPAATPAGRVTASLSVTALRILPALLALGWLQTGGAELRAAGAGEMLAGFYLLALAADLLRTIMGGSQSARRPRDNGAI